MRIGGLPRRLCAVAALSAILSPGHPAAQEPAPDEPAFEAVEAAPAAPLPAAPVAPTAPAAAAERREPRPKAAGFKAQSREPHPAVGFFDALASRPRLARSVSLDDLGFRRPVVFSGADAERQIFFGVPRDVALRDARIELAGSHLKAANGRLTLLADVNGTPATTIDFEGHEGRFVRSVLAPGPDGPEGFLTLGLKFSAVSTGDRCTDQRSIGNVVSVDPRTRLTYQVDPGDIRSVRAAWAVLPHRVKILVDEDPVDAARFDAAVRIALAVHASGRTPEFVALPALGGFVPTAPLQVDPALAGIGAFARLLDAPGKARIATAADRGAYLVLLALSGHALGDIAVGAAGVLETVERDLQALRAELEAELGSGAPAVLASFDRWLGVAQRKADGNDEANLSLAQLLGFPLIRLDTDAAPVSATLLGGRWHRLAGSGSLTVRQAVEGGRTADDLPLARLSGGFAAQAISDYGEWAVSFNASQLPPGRWPNAVELEMRVSPDTADGSPIASVMLNDTLLRAQKVDAESSVFRMTADIPPFLLGANNTLKIALQRGALAGDCRSVPRGYLAQVLPTSRLSLSRASLDGQFFGLLPRFAHTGIAYIPPDYLERPLEALPFTTALLRALSFTSSSLRLAVVDEARPAKPDMAFVAFGSALPGVRAGVEIQQDRLVLAGETRQTLVDLSGAGDVAVARIGEIDGVPGVLVDTRPGARLPVVRVDQLAHGDVAVIDATGVIAELGAAERRADAIDRAMYEPAALIYRYRTHLIAGFGVLSALVLMRIVRAIVTARKRNRGKAQAKA